MAQYDYFATKKKSGFAEWAAKVNRNYLLKLLQNAGLKSGKHVVEIGLGRAEFAQLVQSSGYTYSAYEPAHLLAEHARELGITVYEQFTPPLCEKDETVQALVMSHVLEHFPSLEKVDQLFSEVRRVLDRDGLFLVAVPDIVDWGGWFWECDYTHQFPVSLHMLRHLFEDQQFKIQHIGYVWGAFSWLPGSFLNFLVKNMFKICEPLIEYFYPHNEKILKLRTLFARCVIIVGTKA